MDINSLSTICIANIFSHSILYFLTLFILLVLAYFMSIRLCLVTMFPRVFFLDGSGLQSAKRETHILQDMESKNKAEAIIMVSHGSTHRSDQHVLACPLWCSVPTLSSQCWSHWPAAWHHPLSANPERLSQHRGSSFHSSPQGLPLLSSSAIPDMLGFLDFPACSDLSI